MNANNPSDEQAAGCLPPSTPSVNAEENKNFSEEDVFGYHKATVTWYINAAKDGKHSRTKMDLGYCSYGKGVAFIAVYNPNEPITQEALKPMIIHDVFIHTEKKLCDDAKWCINLTCPLNKADPRYFKRYSAKTRVALEKLHAVLEDVQRKLGLHEEPSCVVTCYEKTPIYISARKK